jgi:hypothetical protein
LREYAPGGVDVFLDNVGGKILDAVLAARTREDVAGFGLTSMAHLARGARIVLSGGVSQCNAQQVNDRR